MKSQLIFPMSAYVLFIWGIAILNFRTRVAAVKKGEMDGKYFRLYQGDPSERVAQVTRHFDNQFQVPILFMITCLVHMQLDQVNLVTVILAWAFVVARLIHSYVHLGRNRIMVRAKVYALGWFFIGLLWLQLLVSAVTAAWL